MQRVFVLDTNRKPLMPCEPARARKLLKAGKAAVFRRYPFTIILKERADGATQPIALKVDPGSRTTGVTLVADGQRGKRVIWAAEIAHRGWRIKDALESRRALRGNRRYRKTRYRQQRKHARPEGWLPPSVMSRVENVFTWANRLYRLTPLASVSVELVKFDTQAMQNAEISGVEYQQGELAGYEVREYLLEKYHRKCVYCGAENVPLEIEHIVPKSRGGSNRVSNLTLACRACNVEKGNRTADEYGHPEVQKQAKQPLKDAAAVNAARWKLYNGFVAAGLPVEAGTGGRTKYNRTRQNYPKAHWIDAACVGESGARVYIGKSHQPLLIKAMGWGTRQMCQTDAYGFPKRHRSRVKVHYGFQTGDMVKGYSLGRWFVGRVTCRANGKFTIKHPDKRDKKVDFSYRKCKALHRADGYSYSYAEG